MTATAQDQTQTQPRVLIEMYDADGVLRLVPVDNPRLGPMRRSSDHLDLAGGTVVVRDIVVEYPSGRRCTVHNEPYAPSAVIPRELRRMELSS